jgi:hypothetical protein
MLFARNLGQYGVNYMPSRLQCMTAHHTIHNRQTSTIAITWGCEETSDGKYLSQLHQEQEIVDDSGHLSSGWDSRGTIKARSLVQSGISLSAFIVLPYSNKLARQKISSSKARPFKVLRGNSQIDLAGKLGVLWCRISSRPISEHSIFIL